MKSYLDFSCTDEGVLTRNGERIDLKFIERKKNPADASVIISHYQTTHTLRNAVESALAQKGAKIELIVVDDGTPGDDFKRVTDEFSNQPFFTRAALQNNSHATVSRNLAIHLANSDFIVPLDADDEIIGDDAVSSLIRHFRSGTHAVFASTNMVGDISGDITEEDDISWVRSLPTIKGSEVDKKFEGRELYVRETRDYSLWELLEYDYNIGLRLFPKQLLSAIGGLDESLGTQCWYNAILELRTMGTFVPVKENSYLYRIHGKNVSTQQTPQRLTAVQAFLVRFFEKHHITYQELLAHCSETFWKVRGIKLEHFNSID